DYLAGNKRTLQRLDRWSNVSLARPYHLDRGLLLSALLLLRASRLALEEKEAGAKCGERAIRGENSSLVLFQRSHDVRSIVIKKSPSCHHHSLPARLFTTGANSSIFASET